MISFPFSTPQQSPRSSFADKGGSPRRETTDETNASSIARTEESEEHGIPWAAPTSLAFVDQNESVSREVSMINELDVIGDELSRVHDDFEGPVLAPLQGQAEMEIENAALKFVTCGE